MFEIFQINNRHAPGEAPSLREIHPTAIDKDGDEGSADWWNLHAHEPDDPAPLTIAATDNRLAG